MRLPWPAPPVLLALALAGCSDSSGTAPPGAPAAAKDVAWDPADLQLSPEELFPPPGSGKGTVTGEVVDEEGRPVGGATVEMVSLPNGSRAGFVPAVHARAVAGPDGRFEVGPVPAAFAFNGLLTAFAPGTARTSLRESAVTRPGWPSFVAGRPARITLHPGCAVRGEVRGEDGGPPAAPVQVWALGRGHPYHEVATTDARGDFTLTAPAGGISVMVVPGAHAPTPQPALLEVAPGRENLLRIAVRRGRDVRGRVVDAATGRPVPGAVVRGYYGRTLDFRAGADGGFTLPGYWFQAFQVRAAGYAQRQHQLAEDAGMPGVGPETVRLLPGIAVRGRVVDLEGRPLAGVRLTGLHRDAEGETVDLVGPRSAADGSFAFVGLPVPSEGREVLVFSWRDGFAPGAASPLRVPAGGVAEGVVLRMRRLAPVRGRVEDEGGAPVEGLVTLRWEPDGGMRPFADRFTTWTRVPTGPDGVFSARVPERSPFAVRVEAAGFFPAEAKGESPSAPAQAEGVEPPPSLVLKVRRGLWVRGLVLDAGGEPLRAGDVRVEPTPPPGGRPSVDAVVGPEGTFEAGALDPGPYDCSVVAPGFLQEVVRRVEAGGERVTVRMRRPGGLTGRLVAPASVPPGTVPTVTVTALGDCAPLPPRVEVRVERADRTFAIGPLAPGKYSVRVVYGDELGHMESVEVRDGRPTDLGELKLVRGGVVAGRVLVAGTPVGAGVVVEVARVLADGRRDRPLAVTTAHDGTFRAGGLLPGPHVLSARPRDRPPAEVAFEVVSGESRSVDVPVAAGGRILLRVEDARGKPVGGARATLRGPLGSLRFWREGSPDSPPYATGPDGTLRCAGVAAGRVVVSVDTAGAGSGEAEVLVVDGADAPARVVLR